MKNRKIEKEKLWV